MRFVISFIIITGIAALTGIKSLKAQNSNEFYDNLLLSEEFVKVDEGKEARNAARSRLQTDQEKIKIDNDRLNEVMKKQKVRRTKAEMDSSTAKLMPAPFGLLWGASYRETLSSGVKLTKTFEKDYINSFIADELPKALPNIRYVVVTFGQDNRLWRIIAYGDFIQDTPSASKVLEQYNQYYRLLNKKYGNAEQTYNPKINRIEKIIDLGKGKTKTEIEEIPSTIGNDNFLAELQNGETDLYSTFYNSDVGAALSINVDGSGNSYIILEYKNLKIFQDIQDKTMDAL